MPFDVPRLALQNGMLGFSLWNRPPYPSEAFNRVQNFWYVLSIKNEKTNPSLCWKIFGFPTKKAESTDQFERIEGFTSCHLCYQTFAYTSNNGTRNMLARVCVKNVSHNKITTFTTTSSSLSQLNLGSMMNNYKQVKLNEKEINHVKDITCSWICHDMRSFKIIQDNG